MVITQLIFAIQELNFNRQGGTGAGIWMPDAGYRRPDARGRILDNKTGIRPMAHSRMKWEWV